jgi:hypothetical protein
MQVLTIVVAAVPGVIVAAVVLEAAVAVSGVVVVDAEESMG